MSHLLLDASRDGKEQVQEKLERKQIPAAAAVAAATAAASCLQFVK